MSKQPTSPTKPATKVLFHQEKCITCNTSDKNPSNWDIHYTIAKKGAVCTVLLRCVACGDTKQVTATIHNLRNTFGLEKIDKHVGKLPL